MKWFSHFPYRGLPLVAPLSVFAANKACDMLK